VSHKPTIDNFDDPEGLFIPPAGVFKVLIKIGHKTISRFFIYDGQNQVSIVPYPVQAFHSADPKVSETIVKPERSAILEVQAMRRPERLFDLFLIFGFDHWLFLIHLRFKVAEARLPRPNHHLNLIL
jgi:hypothetical protein